MQIPQHMAWHQEVHSKLTLSSVPISPSTVIPQTISHPLRSFSLALAEILGSREPHVPEDLILVLSTHHCNLILGIAV